MSKRLPVIAVGVLVVVLLAAPYAIGMINDNAMHREVERMAGRGLFTTTIESFDRGWFSTTARVQFGIDPEYLSLLQGDSPDLLLGAMLGGLTLPVIVEIQHGPVLLDDGFGLGTASVHAYVAPDAQLAAIAKQMLGMPYIIDIRGRGGFGTGFHYRGDIPPIDFSLSDVSVSSAGVNFSGVSHGGDGRFEAELGNLSLQTPFASAILESLMISSNMSRANVDDFPLGTADFSLGRLSVIDPLQGTADVLAIEDTGFSSSTAVDDSGDYVDMQALYRVGRLNVPNELELTDLRIGLNLNHIDFDALNELYRLSSTLTETAETDPAAALAQLEPLGSQVLAGGPMLTIDPLSLSMPEGDLDGRLSLALDAGALPTGQLSDLQDAAAVMSALSASLDLTASKPLAERLARLVVLNQAGAALGPPEQAEAAAAAQASVLLVSLTVQGLLVDDGDSYTTSIQLANGVPTANGQPLQIGF